MGVRGILPRRPVTRAPARSRGRGERQFDRVQACSTAAFDEAAEGLRLCLTAAIEPCDSWDSALQAAIDAGVGWLVEWPSDAHMCILAPLCAAPGLRRHQQDTIVALTRAITREHERLAGGTAPSVLAFELFVGAARELLAQELLEGRVSEITELAGRLRHMTWLIDFTDPLDG